jgi:uncharacterized protein YjbJ (UPF0337 family)
MEGARRCLQDELNIEEKLPMNKDRMAGAGKEMKGKVKEMAGKVDGDAKTEAEGKMEKAADKAQQAYGSARDAVKETIKGD